MNRSKSALRSRGSFILLLAFAFATLLGPRVLAQSQEASLADYNVYSAFLNTQLAGHNGIDDLRVGACPRNNYSSSLMVAPTRRYEEAIERTAGRHARVVREVS